MGEAVPTIGERGQAAVEAALTLPLTIFLILGTLQLFMILQARIMAEVAVFAAVRAGSLNHGDCNKMKQAALVPLLPTITVTNTPGALATAFRDRCRPCNPNARIRYNPTKDVNPSGGAPYNMQILEIYREQPVAGSWPTPEDTDFDAPRSGGQIQRLEIRMIYWYRLRIPFADWVMSRMFLAHFGLQNYTAQNPLMEAQTATNWQANSTTLDTSSWPGGSLSSNMLSWASSGRYLVPIRVTAAMRMMTPPKDRYFSSQGCPAP